jgi:cobalt-zinc-cadmium resistance protein CzcA
LRSVPGVIEVNTMGGEVKQYQVVLDPRKMAGFKLTLREVLTALQQNNTNVGGGYIEKNNEQIVIRGEAQFKDAEDIADTVLAVDGDGTPTLLKRIADVRIGPALRYGVVTMHGKGEIVAGTVMMLIGENSREVVKHVKEKITEIQADLPAGVKIVPYYDRAEFIERMLTTVGVNLAEGAALVIAVLFLMLGSLRGSLLAALAIPLSMGVAVIGMRQLGVTGNLMSLGAIDFGLLVDGAIVMLEGTLHSLDKQRPPPDEVPAAVAKAMARAAKPVAFAVGIIMLVYLPLMALEGVEGKMFRPMAITVAMALAGALLFTLTTFPAACAYALRAPKKSHAHDRRGLMVRLTDGYAALLGGALRRPALVLAAAGLALGIAVPFGGSLGAEFVPRLEEGEFSLDVRRLPSVGISTAKDLSIQVEQVAARFPEALSVVTRLGRAEVATDPVGVDESQVRIKLRPPKEWTTAKDMDTLGAIMKETIEKEVPATYVAISQPIEDRVNQLLSGSRADLAIKVFGPDLETLRGIGNEIAAVLRQVPGTGDLRVQRALGLPLLDVRVDRLRLARHGIPAAEVLATVEAARAGINAGKVFEDTRRFDVTLLQPPPRPDPESIGEVPVGTENGVMVPLAQLASIQTREGPATISREALERRLLVEANVRGRDLVSYVGESRARVEAQVKLPQGYKLVWAGQFENFTRAKDRLLIVVPIALAIIFGMLFLMFGEIRTVACVFACVPLGLAGGIVALHIRGLPFSIPAAVGFIALCGVAVLNGVVMASELHRRLANWDEKGNPFVESAAAVLRPVITTALVAAIGFIPMAISTRAGAEVQRPLATVVIGGILSSTLLSLFVLPTLLKLLVRRPRPEA